MDSRYKLLSELLSDQAAFITSPKTSLANYWGHCPPVSTGLHPNNKREFSLQAVLKTPKNGLSDCTQKVMMQKGNMKKTKN